MNERGLAESTQWAVVVPALLTLVLGLVQTGVWLHARSVAAQAAAAAADLRASGTAAAADSVATAIAARGGLADVVVATATTGSTVTVTVAGSAPLILDLGLGRVTERAVLPMEQVTSP